MKPISAFGKCRKAVPKVNEMMKVWKDKQMNLIKQCMSVKEVQKVKLDQWRKVDEYATNLCVPC